jgi:sulfide:quinone oxidoreductase
MANETVLILGGGVGGVSTALELRKKLPPEHRIVVIDRTGVHLFQPALLKVMTGGRQPERIVRDLVTLERRGIEVVRGEIEAIDPERRSVTVNGTALEGDAMVITLGAQLTPQRIPGLAEAGTTFYTVEGAEAIRDGRTGFMRGRLVVLVAGLPFKCPAAPYEAAMLLEHDLRRRGVREQVEVSLHTPEPGPMGVTGPKVSAAVRGLVEDRGIGYHPQHAVAEVDPGAKEITFADGDRAPYDWLVYIPPVSAPAVVVDAGLTDESGWIKVDPHTLETGHAGVYAIGDVTTIPVATGAPLPKAGVFADHEAKVVANNISVRLTGQGSLREFAGDGG